MISQDEISKLHNGLYRCPSEAVKNLMPTVWPIVKTLPCDEYPLWRYVFDVKVHMLMPGQYPCIPNWHYDMVPRDENNKQDFSQIRDDSLFIWLSGAPLTEFKDPVKHEDKYIQPGEWKRFSQKDLHRGSVSTKHQWRLFIRACPDTILQAAPEEQWLRRHSQVYLNSENFKW